jgi:hypothetical protein
MLSRGSAFQNNSRSSVASEAEILCTFWCMFASDVTASHCDILQSRTGAQIFCCVWVMRIRALMCSLLQDSKIWTQNPSKATSWGFNSPSRHQSHNLFHTRHLEGPISCVHEQFWVYSGPFQVQIRIQSVSRLF